MLTRFIQRITRLFAGGITRNAENPSLNVPAKPSRNSAQYNGRVNGTYPHHRLNQNGSLQNHASVDGYRHNAERLLRDGHLRIAITGFNDTAFDVSVMGRHDSPQLAMRISDLPCKMKMVDQRNISAGLLAAIKTLDDGSPGRRGIVLITSGDAESGQDHLQQLAARAAALKIGIHVICLGIRTDDPTGARRISTKDALGYGNFRMVGSDVQLLAAIREAFQGLTPAFGMRGTNKAVILLDCSETMVEAYRDTTRIDMAISALRKFLEAPLVRIGDAVRDARQVTSFRPRTSRKPVSWQSHNELATAGAYDWSPRST